MGGEESEEAQKSTYLTLYTARHGHTHTHTHTHVYI